MKNEMKNKNIRVVILALALVMAIMGSVFMLQPGRAVQADSTTQPDSAIAQGSTPASDGTIDQAASPDATAKPAATQAKTSPTPAASANKATSAPKASGSSSAAATPASTASVTSTGAPGSNGSASDSGSGNADANVSGTQYSLVNKYTNDVATQAQSLTASLTAKSAIMIDENTGSVLYQMNPETPLPIASITKIMSLILVFESLESGEIKLDDMVPISKNAAETTGSAVPLTQGEQVSVEDLLKSVAIHSANDSCVALAEFIGGTEKKFVNRMNDKAASLGLKNTNFVDCTGLNDTEQTSTVYDVAIMARDLVLNHPESVKYTSTTTDTFKSGQPDETQLFNTNTMMSTYAGMYGIKTGTTDRAGNCLVAGAERNGLNIISVVLNCPTTTDRFSDTNKILNFGFKNFESVQLAKSGTYVGDADIKGTLVKDKPAVYKDDVNVVLQKGTSGNVTSENTFVTGLKAPMKSGDKVGETVFKDDQGDVIVNEDLVLGQDVPRSSWFRILIALFESWMSFKM